jgi:malonyl-CoA/methylmalonyl-CoA synthetase
VPTGAVGHIEVRGTNVFPGYWQLPEATATAFTADGYFRTGDLGRLDGDGYLHIAGRSKDLVITGGLNVYPKEVEREIEQSPAVLEAAVFGVPHADFGEAVVAAVIPRDGNALDADALLAGLRSRLAAYKLPKRILVLDELPRNVMGKVQKNRLRAEFAGLFGGGDSG